MKNRLLLLSLVALAALVYLPGLSGEFIFDDTGNFENLQRWADGRIGWQPIVFDHPAGPLGRPLAMATFLGNTAVSGVDPFAFKLTNLLLHLVTGLVVFLVVQRLARREPALARRAEIAAIAITAIWLLHPMMVSTVLYVVQRMAILAALFMLLAILAYLHGRTLLDDGQTRRGSVWILAGVPVLTALGALSKENAMLAPLICVAIELTLYPSRTSGRPTVARLFLILGGLLPVLAALALFIVKPGFFLDGFENRPFNLLERLMTQGRVLFDYVGQLLLPRGPQMSLFRDDYAVSTGLFQPWTTMLAWIGWVLIISAAWAVRKKIPGFTAGIAIFLTGHAMESSIFPLLLYFEHRNYFPAAGLFFAIASVLAYACNNFQSSAPNIGKISYVAIICMLALLSGATISRSTVWSSNETLLTQSLEHYPGSRTLRMELAQLLMNKTPPQLEAAQSHYRYLLSDARASTRIIGAAGLIASSCYATKQADLRILARTISEPVKTLEADVVSALTSLSLISSTSSCAGIRPSDLARQISSMLDQLSIDSDLKNIWQLRFRSAQLYAADQLIDEAISELELAIAADGWDPPVGMLMLELQLKKGNDHRAAEILHRLADRIHSSDLEGQHRLQHYREKVKNNTS